MDRFGIESGQWPSPGTCPLTPLSGNNTADQSFAGSRVPLAPSICLDHLWTESGKLPRYTITIYRWYVLSTHG